MLQCLPRMTAWSVCYAVVEITGEELSLPTQAVMDTVSGMQLSKGNGTQTPQRMEIASEGQLSEGTGTQKPKRMTEQMKGKSGLLWQVKVRQRHSSA